MSWRDARAYAYWLSLRTGEPYRLPSEAEWEYAARAGTQDLGYWGDDLDEKQVCSFANGPDLTTKEQSKEWVTNNCEDGSIFTSPVGSSQRNGFGLSDIIGNVWEWTEDCWHENYKNAPVTGEAWLSDAGGDCSRRVLRGGGWYDEPQFLRSAFRFRYLTDDTGIFVGFRLARAFF